MTGLMVPALVLLAVVPAVWPAHWARTRHRRLAAGRRPAHDRGDAGGLATGGPVRVGRALQRVFASYWPWLWPAPVLSRVPIGAWPAPVLAAGGVAAASVAGLLASGPVAAAVIAGYGILAVRVVAARARTQARSASRTDLFDALDTAAADLRAGIPATTALAVLPAVGRVADPAAALGPAAGPGLAAVSGLAAVPGPAASLAAVPGPASVPGPAASLARTGTDPLVGYIAGAVQLAERTGAPLADLLERIEADARAADRARAAANAQAAGSQATAGLLTALPAGGLAVGHAIGADPLAVLLHTPFGAACALGAMGLQLVGLAWARRIIRPAPDGAP